MQVRKWGDSLAIELPHDVVETLQLREGDEIEMTATSNGAIEVQRKPSRQQLMDRLKEFEERLPADFKFDRDEANAR